MSPIDGVVAAVAHKATAVILTAVVVCTPVFGAQTKASSRTCHNSRYTVVELPFLPKAISPLGIVAGVDDTQRTVVWSPERGMQNLPVPGGFRYTEPVGITRSGAVVINASDAQAKQHAAFVYFNNTLTRLPGRQVMVHGVNSAGRIVGEWVPEGRLSSDAVYWDNQEPHSLGLCCGGTLKAGNALGSLTGNEYDTQGHYHAFVWQAGQSRRSLAPAAGYSAAVGITDAGHVLVQVGREGYLDQAGDLQHLDLSPKLFNALYGINNCDFVVGGYGTDSDHYRGFLWTPAGGFQDLNSLIPPDAGWLLEAALAIDDRGEIVGRGERQRDDSGFLLIPRSH